VPRYNTDYQYRVRDFYHAPVKHVTRNTQVPKKLPSIYGVDQQPKHPDLLYGALSSYPVRTGGVVTAAVKNAWSCACRTHITSWRRA